MEIIVLSKRTGSGSRLCLGRGGRVLMTALVVVALGASGMVGYRAGMQYSRGAEQDRLQAELERELARQRQSVGEARAHAQHHLDALALQLGGMEARLMRLDALGQRLVEKGQLDAEEFGFGDGRPALGGPRQPALELVNTVPDFVTELEALARRLDDREERLAGLDALLHNRSLQEEVSPSGRPLKKGWISSYFGTRKDPITGRKSHHEGLDIAGRKGSEVIAVASGVVVFSGRRSGFGRVVDVDHGNGLVTRYAHNAENLVAVGDKVSKGQAIAYVGESGRATGPHVHFEVLRDDRPVNPMSFIRAGKG